MFSEGILPKGLDAEMSALRRKMAIAERALLVPDAQKTAWDVFCATAVQTAQSRGVVAERVVCKLMRGDLVPSGDDRGDFICDDVHYEVKSSFTPGKMNVRQVRPWQDVAYIIVHVNVEDKDDCQCYRLTHAQMAEEVALCGSVSHGTKAAVEGNMNREYSLTIPTRSKRLNGVGARWERYRDHALETLLF